jgi:hypothetical protein
MKRNKKVRLVVSCMFMKIVAYIYPKKFYLPANIKGKIIPIITKKKKPQWLLRCG